MGYPEFMPCPHLQSLSASKISSQLAGSWPVQCAGSRKLPALACPRRQGKEANLYMVVICMKIVQTMSVAEFFSLSPDEAKQTALTDLISRLSMLLPGSKAGWYDLVSRHLVVKGAPKLMFFHPA
eukprot:scaffold73177_cov15-Tisochrysis_lutea.AAC.2